MQSLLCLLSFYLSSYSLLTLFMFLSPLGERFGEGVPKTISCITPSPSLSPKGERSIKGEARGGGTDAHLLHPPLTPPLPRGGNDHVGRRQFRQLAPTT